MLHALVVAVALVASAPEPVGPPAGQEPRRLEGVGWLTAGALAGGLGLGLGLASSRQLAMLDDCEDCPRRLPPTMFAAVVLNTASLGLLTAGASVRGRVRGLQDGPHSRSAEAPWIALGGLATAAGVIFVAAGLSWRFAPWSQDSATPWVLLQVGLSSVVAGSSLLVYGLTHRRYATNSRAVRLRVAPQLGWRHAGVALVGFF